MIVDVTAMSTKLTTLKKDAKEIWNADEVTAGAEFDDVDDPRRQPEFVITFLSTSIDNIVFIIISTLSIPSLLKVKVKVVPYPN